MRAKTHPNPTNFREKGITRKKVVKPKSTNFASCSTYSASDEKNLESSEALENETLHIVSQLLPFCVRQISSKSNNFQRKRAGEEKGGQSEKDELLELLDLFCFQSKNFESKGNVGCWDFTYTLVNYLHYVCAEFYPNPTTFRVKGLARKKWSNEKEQISRDARPTLLPMTKHRIKRSLGSWGFACS